MVYANRFMQVVRPIRANAMSRGHGAIEFYFLACVLFNLILMTILLELSRETKF